MATKRSDIKDTVKIRLWAKAGGRCEICNKSLLEDGFTGKEDNFAQIAHNIPSSPKGPRSGNNSRDGVNSFDNLLLLCGEHHKLIDGINRVDYSVETLREYKQKHEDRIEIQTSIQPNKRSTIVLLNASIGTSPVSVTYDEACNAIVPNYYPLDKKGLQIDLRSISQPTKSAYWKTVGNEIRTNVKDYMKSYKPEHLSVFGLAPVPALVLLGKAVGNITPNEVYQKQRTSDGWNWPTSKPDTKFKYTVKKPSKIGTSKEVAIVASLSGTINLEEIKAVQAWNSIYEIGMDNPNPYFIDHITKLEQFRKTYRELLSDIVTKHGQDITVSLFLAVPNSIAVACGQEILPKADPAIWTYEYISAEKKFIKALKIN